MDCPEIPRHRPQSESSSSLTTESVESLSTDSSPIPHLPAHRPHKHATGVTENDNPKSIVSSPQIPFSRPQRSKSSDINETPVVPKRRPVIKDNEIDTRDSLDSIPIVPSKRPSVHKSELSSTSILPCSEESITFSELGSTHRFSTDPIESTLPTSELNIPTTNSAFDSSPIIPSSRPQRTIESNICPPSVSLRDLGDTSCTENTELNSAKEEVNEPTKMPIKDDENIAEECEDNSIVTNTGNKTSAEENPPTVENDESEFIVPASRPSKNVSKIEKDINSVEKELELQSELLNDVPAEEFSSEIENTIEEKKGETIPDETQVETEFDAKKVVRDIGTKDNKGSTTNNTEDSALHVESSSPTIPLSRPKKPTSELITEKDMDNANHADPTAASVSTFQNSRPGSVNDVDPIPKIPLKRPSQKQNESEDSVTSGSEKKAVPKVPKKPSSKIAQFQMMLEQQQKQDLGLMNKPKHRPKPPVKRPTISEKDLDEESKDEDIPDPEEKEMAGASPKVGKLSSRFTQNLNGMIGMALPGMGMAFGGSPVASMQAATEIQDKGKIHEVKQVTDVRRARARGPRGRKLPDAVQKTVEINDETLGNTFTIFAEDSWSFSFKRPVTKETEGDKEETEENEEKEKKEEKEPNAEFNVETKECLQNVDDEKDSDASEVDQNDFMTATEGIVEPEPSIEIASDLEQSSGFDSTGKAVTDSPNSNLGSLELSSKEQSLEPSEGQSILGSPVTGSSVLSSSEDGIVEDGEHTSSGVLSV